MRIPGSKQKAAKVRRIKPMFISEVGVNVIMDSDTGDYIEALDLYSSDGRVMTVYMPHKTGVRAICEQVEKEYISIST